MGLGGCAGDSVHKGLRKELAVVGAIALLSLAVRTLAALTTDIFQDEGVYWKQAYEGLSFSPHPPAAPLMVRLGLAVFGQNMLGLRAASLVAGTASVVMAYVLGRRMYGRRAGVWAAALFACCPLFAGIGAVATPDAPLVLAWMAFIYASWRAGEACRAARKGAMGWRAVAGVVLAAGLYTKYMMVLAIPSLGLALLLTRDGRAQLKSLGPWLGALIGVALFAPVLLIWDWRHAWPTLQYHLVARHQWVVSGGQIATYVASHVGAISPLLIIGVFWALLHWWPSRRNHDWRGVWISAFGWVPIVFFVLPSAFTLRTMNRVHWDAVGYAAGLVAFAFLLREGGVRGRVLRRRRWLAAAGMAFGTATIVVTLVTVWSPALAADVLGKPPSIRMLGWRELAEGVENAQEEWNGPARFIVADSFRTALCLSFHLGARDGVYTLFHSSNRRYGLTEELERWGTDEPSMVREQLGQDALYVHEYRFDSDKGREDPPMRIHLFFTRVEKVADVYVVRGGVQLKHFGLFNCHELKLKPRARPTR